MSNYQSSETFAWSLLVSNTESESEMFSEFDRVVARKNTQVFLHDKPKTSCSRRIFMNEQQPTSPEKSAAVTDVAFHSTHRNGYQSKLLFFHSKGDRCSLWGLLHRDELTTMEHCVIAVILFWIFSSCEENFSELYTWKKFSTTPKIRGNSALSSPRKSA